MKRHHWAGALAFIAVAVPAAGQATLYKDIRDWSVTCSNGLTCEMGFADWNAKGIRSIAFSRTSEPNASTEIVLSPPEGYEAGKDDQGQYELLVDGKAVAVLPVAKMTFEEQRGRFHFGDLAVVTALIDAMKAGTAMEMRYTGKLGTFALPVKLSGVKGSLVFIDEAQQRIGRKDALDAKGDAEPPAQAPARDIIKVEDLPETIRADFTAEDGACNGVDTANLSGAFSIAYEATNVIMVPCGTGGAYNQPYAVYFGYDIITERGAFPEMTDSKTPSTESTAYNVDYDPKTKTFTSFFRGRGIGDCGGWSKWGFSESGSPTLLLMEQRVKGDCDENDMGGPQNFPLTWPVKK